MAETCSTPQTKGSSRTLATTRLELCSRGDRSACKLNSAIDDVVLKPTDQIGGLPMRAPASWFRQGRQMRHPLQESIRNLGARSDGMFRGNGNTQPRQVALRSEEHTSELQSLMRISYAVFCLQ